MRQSLTQTERKSSSGGKKEENTSRNQSKHRRKTKMWCCSIWPNSSSSARSTLCFIEWCEDPNPRDSPTGPLTRNPTTHRLCAITNTNSQARQLEWVVGWIEKTVYDWARERRERIGQSADIPALASNSHTHSTLDPDVARLSGASPSLLKALHNSRLRNDSQHGVSRWAQRVKRTLILLSSRRRKSSELVLVM